MKPVSCSSLGLRVERKSILMLDITRLTINYIENVLPGNIFSKQGKYLPPEIWTKILDLAARDDKSHRYCPVQPRSLEESRDGSITLVCAQITEWYACGELYDVKLVKMYERYLSRPYDYRRGRGDRPFRLPDDEAIVFRIPTAALDKKILFEGLTVPDFIARAERGRCHLCYGRRSFCASCDGRWILQEWTSAEPCEDCVIRMLCPLCMGVYFAEGSVGWYQELLWDPELGDLEQAREKYNAWANKRFAELGYTRFD